MKGLELQFVHPHDDGKKYKVMPVHVFVTADDRLYVLGICKKCRSQIGIYNKLEDLKSAGKDLNVGQPLVPPLALPPAKFTDNDKLEAHGLSIILPEDL